MSEKMGRPTLYTDELAKEICNTIATHGVGLETLCRENPHWPSARVIYRWINDRTNFRQAYAIAKREQVEVFINDILEISDEVTQDTHRDRLRIDTRKWLASKLIPRLWGKSTEDEEVDDSD